MQPNHPPPSPPCPSWLCLFRSLPCLCPVVLYAAGLAAFCILDHRARRHGAFLASLTMTTNPLCAGKSAPEAPLLSRLRGTGGVLWCGRVNSC